jgi:DNA-binding response OmpR family regulator
MNLSPRYFFDPHARELLVSAFGNRRSGLNGFPRVLIVDESAESRDVLRTLLERHGVTTMEAPRLQQAIGMSSGFRPHVIVVDAESDHSTGGLDTATLHEDATRNGVAVVILGTVRPNGCPSAAGQFVAKPYHYGQLLRKIESLLAAA